MTAYKESDVSLLIPVYRPGPFFRATLESALATSVGEIIVSINDAYQYPVTEFDDILLNPRLNVIRQSQQLGLWGNHLYLLKKSTRPWIKFLHGDDKITHGFLQVMLDHVDERVSVIGTVVFCENLNTGFGKFIFRMDAPKRWTSNDYMQRVCVTGNELGTPSSTLYRREILDISAGAWLDTMSCDYVNNIIAASRGDVVLLPPGGIISGDHEMRDSQIQGLNSIVIRSLNTASYLSRFPDARVRKFGRVHGVVEGLGLYRVIAGMLRRGKLGAVKYLGSATAMTAKYLTQSLLAHDDDVRVIKNAIKWKYDSQKYGPRLGRDLGRDLSGYEKFIN
ncbi:MAG: glycosyltransferase [Chromatiaceae bacterium]|nr:glycosyltransferase [Chromatiaceae bacterium]